jgi:hypothetical protein
MVWEMTIERRDFNTPSLAQEAPPMCAPCPRAYTGLSEGTKETTRTEWRARVHPDDLGRIEEEPLRRWQQFFTNWSPTPQSMARSPTRTGEYRYNGGDCRMDHLTDSSVAS